MRIPTRKPGKYTSQRRDPHMTQAKVDDLKAQLARMLAQRPAAAAEVKHLAEMGDFSENAAYQIAKGRLRGLNERIMEVEDHLKYAQVIQPSGTTNQVELGSVVTVEQGREQKTFTILGPTETNPAKGIISYQSPLGAALMHKRVGDTVTLQLQDRPTTIRIVKVG